MYFAALACLRRKSSTSSSLTISSVPNPPGTQITSSCGQSAKVMVGVSVSTESLATGSIRFQIRCTFAPGTLEKTCTGPVRSSWVTFGNITRPICSGSDMTTSEVLRLDLQLVIAGQKRVFALDDPAIHPPARLFRRMMDARIRSGHDDQTCGGRSHT